jgi:hypothetical protein
VLALYNTNLLEFHKHYKTQAKQFVIAQSKHYKTTAKQVGVVKLALYNSS